MVDDGLDALRELVWADVAPGFTPRSHVLERVLDVVADDHPGVDAAAAAALVDELWATRLAQLAAPVARRPTDDARVAAAFTELDAAGLVAWLGCGYDQGEALDLCAEAARARGAHGFAYCHGQDLERLAFPDPVLWVGFDALPLVARRWRRAPSRDEQVAAVVAVGRQVADALAGQGLTVRWDGSRSTRVTVVGLDWRRPLPEG